MSAAFQRGIVFLAMGRRPSTKRGRPNPPGPSARRFQARFPNGTSIQRAHTERVFSHAYLVLYERPDGKDGFQRGFCTSLDKAEAKVDAEMRWLSGHSHTLVEAFIVEAEDVTGKIRRRKRGRMLTGR